MLVADPTCGEPVGDPAQNPVFNPMLVADATCVIGVADIGELVGVPTTNPVFKPTLFVVLSPLGANAHESSCKPTKPKGRRRPDPTVDGGVGGATATGRPRAPSGNLTRRPPAAW